LFQKRPWASQKKAVLVEKTILGAPKEAALFKKATLDIRKKAALSQKRPWTSEKSSPCHTNKHPFCEPESCGGMFCGCLGHYMRRDECFSDAQGLFLRRDNFFWMPMLSFWEWEMFCGCPSHYMRQKERLLDARGWFLRDGRNGPFLGRYSRLLLQRFLLDKIACIKACRSGKLVQKQVCVEQLYFKFF